VHREYLRFFLAFMVFIAGLTPCLGQLSPAIPPPDNRYKVDVLEIVGHPDDDIDVAAYVAKLIEQQHKRVAVVYATRGNAGGNAVGMEQSNAFADVREMEARHSLASYGIIDAWFLHGADTPGADVLHSLEAWGHGQALDEIVRLVRLTRPEVILTWLPDYVVGENHEDHQGAGVLATEAFDLAANPVAFPEQVEAPRHRLDINNYGEGLRPWQPKKIYYFSDATHSEFFQDNGPQYPTGEISPSRRVPYSQVAADAWNFYKTQGDFTADQLKEFTKTPIRLVFGKSLVGGSATGDVFEGVNSAPIPYVKARGYDTNPADVSVELGGPWAFYRQFWRAHNIEHIANLFSPEAQVGPGESLWVPLLIRNHSSAPARVELHANLPAGWTAEPAVGTYEVGAGDEYPVQLTIKSASSDKDEWRTLEWRAEANRAGLPAVFLRVMVKPNGLPQ
jgi:LmbE family N-acetylglucosaminyl deacetylase